MKTDLYNQKAEKTGSTEVNDKVFDAKVNDKVLSQYVYVYLSNQREGNAHTKGKAEVSGGGRKPWKQKGTGRARAGMNRSPLWKGGGVTFGPTNKVNWSKKTTKNFRKVAFRSAFSKVNKLGNLFIVDKLEFNTKEALVKQGLGLLKSFEAKTKPLIITANKDEKLLNSMSNIKHAKVTLVTEVNPYDILRARKIIVTQDSLEYINKWGE